MMDKKWIEQDAADGDAHYGSVEGLVICSLKTYIGVSRIR